jgi:hypothetical protein
MADVENIIDMPFKILHIYSDGNDAITANPSKIESYNP